MYPVAGCGAMSKRKGLSLEEKREKMVELLQEAVRCLTFPSRASVSFSCKRLEVLCFSALMLSAHFLTLTSVLLFSDRFFLLIMSLMLSFCLPALLLDCLFYFLPCGGTGRVLYAKRAGEDCSKTERHRCVPAFLVDECFSWAVRLCCFW